MAESDVLSLRWKSPGPVSTAFMHGTKPVQILNGPIGAGKTRTVFTKALKLSAAQMPSPRTGVRMFKLCTVHENYRQLWRSTIPSWWKLIPKEGGDWNGAVDGPAKHVINFKLPDGTTVLFQNDFIAIGDNAVEDVMRGYEPTAFYLNEMDLHARDVFIFARGRAGRYPDVDDGGPSWYGILGDCNAPEFGSWLYDDIFVPVLGLSTTADAEDDAAVQPELDGDEEKIDPAEVDLLVQPSGLSPQAENLANLPKGYYARQVSGQPKWYVERMIKNVPGYNRAGKPVITEYNSDQHNMDGEMLVVPGMALTMGVDSGGHPAAVFGQRLTNGQWRIYEELVGEQGTGAIRFGRMVARVLRERFPGMRFVRAWADPSSTYGVDRKEGEKDWLEIMSEAAGIRVDPAPTNELEPRLEALRHPFSHSTKDGQPSILISRRCPVLRQAMAVGYQYRKLNVSGATKFTDEPDKNHPYSDIADALGYLLSGGGEDLEIRGRKSQRQGATSGVVRVSDWDPLANA